MLNNIKKTTSRFEKALQYSQVKALQDKKKQIEPVDMLLALLEVDGSIAREVLLREGYQERKEVKSLIKQDILNTPKKEVRFSTASKSVIQKSVALAAKMKHPYIGTEHLLYALLEKKDINLEKILGKNFSREKALEQLKFVFESTLNFNQLQQMVDNMQEDMQDPVSLEEEGLMDKIKDIYSQGKFFSGEGVGRENEDFSTATKLRSGKENKKAGMVGLFAKELTNKEVQKQIDPLIGREEEVKRLIQILSRRNKNNPVLLGDAGVGKTAIVEGLAKKIIEGAVPDVLINKRIFALDINMMVAGAMMRGEFESRLKKVIDEVKNDPDIILFIDELHNVVGAGSAGGTMDAANILKPALSRGELRCIGATTFEEYKKYIEEDPALERRFQPVKVFEPNQNQAVEILKGVKENYENHHLVKINEEAIKNAVDFSSRYITDRNLPDKALDLIDEAAARIKVESGIVDEDMRKLKLVQSKWEDLEDKKQNLVAEEKYEAALKLREKQESIMQEMNELENEMFSKNKEQKFLGRVTTEDVAKAASQISGVPLENILSTQGKQIKTLLKGINKRIVAQDKVKKELFFYLKKAKLGLAAETRPLGCFMFLGPSGVGKTYTAKVLADEFFGTVDKKSNLVRFDMSEFSEKFNISRLIGSPAGYVGYKEGGKLTEAVRRNPYSVVLFDEIEKAHSEVYNLLLQIMDEGYLKDATGKYVDFRNTIIILTSNLGAQKFYQANIGFGEDGVNTSNEEEQYKQIQREVKKQVKNTFKPELVNRLDKIFVFKPLAEKSLEKIVEIELSRLRQVFKKYNLKLSWSKRLVKHLAHKAYSPKSGARKVRQTVQQKVENKLVEEIMEKDLKNQQVTLDYIKKQVVIK